ncbi:MAG: polyphenol oxidase family protein, partial [Patescibacteria group bacterium]|nr:polyphenol oxidase family protein [Patescibacteria group bacterium]
DQIRIFLEIFAPSSYHYPHITKLEHGDKIAVIDNQYLEQINMSGYEVVADGIMTDIPGMPLVVRSADCAPVFIYDSINHAVGLFHCGWKGIAKKLVEKGVKKKEDIYGSDPRNLTAVIGPHAGAFNNDYEVGEDVLDAFSKSYKDVTPFFCENRRNKGHYFLNIAGAIIVSLLEVGMVEYNIQQSFISTMSPTGRALFHSHRAEGKERKGKTSPMVAVLK